MSNMSYCRFGNTVPDLMDCHTALNEGDFDIATMINEAVIQQEGRAMKRFVSLIVEIYGDLHDAGYAADLDTTSKFEDL